MLDLEVAGSRSAKAEKTLPLNEAQKQLDLKVQEEKFKRLMK